MGIKYTINYVPICRCASIFAKTLWVIKYTINYGPICEWVSASLHNILLKIRAVDCAQVEWYSNLPKRNLVQMLVVPKRTLKKVQVGNRAALRIWFRGGQLLHFPGKVKLQWCVETHCDLGGLGEHLPPKQFFDLKVSEIISGAFSDQMLS